MYNEFFFFLLNQTFKCFRKTELHQTVEKKKNARPRGIEASRTQKSTESEEHCLRSTVWKMTNLEYQS